MLNVIAKAASGAVTGVRLVAAGATAAGSSFCAAASAFFSSSASSAKTPCSPRFCSSQRPAASCARHSVSSHFLRAFLGAFCGRRPRRAQAAILQIQTEPAALSGQSKGE